MSALHISRFTIDLTRDLIESPMSAHDLCQRIEAGSDIRARLTVDLTPTRIEAARSGSPVGREIRDAYEALVIVSQYLEELGRDRYRAGKYAAEAPSGSQLGAIG